MTFKANVFEAIIRPSDRAVALSPAKECPSPDFLAHLQLAESDLFVGSVRGLARGVHSACLNAAGVWYDRETNSFRDTAASLPSDESVSDAEEAPSYPRRCVDKTERRDFASLLSVA